MDNITNSLGAMTNQAGNAEQGYIFVGGDEESATSEQDITPVNSSKSENFDIQSDQFTNSFEMVSDENHHVTIEATTEMKVEQIDWHIPENIAKLYAEQSYVSRKESLFSKEFGSMTNRVGNSTQGDIRQTLPGLLYQKIPGDGHCLYNAIALHIGLDTQVIRNLVAASLEYNKIEYEPIVAGLLIQGQTFESYVNGIISGEWGDNLQLSILMRLLDRAILVVHSDRRIEHIDAVKTYPNYDPIFVFYNGHNHYDAFIRNSDLSGRQIVEQLTQLNEHFQDINFNHHQGINPLKTSWSQEFEEHLKKLCKLLSIKGHTEGPTCFISYAWPIEKENGLGILYPSEKYLQGFLKTLHKHLKLAGIIPILDIIDCSTNDNIFNFMTKASSSDFALLFLTQSLKCKHEDKNQKMVHDEMQRIRKRNEQEKPFCCISLGKIEACAPYGYQGYVNIIDWTENGKNYLNKLKNLIGLIYKAYYIKHEILWEESSQIEYNEHWGNITESIPAVDDYKKELKKKYHERYMDEFIRSELYNHLMPLKTDKKASSTSNTVVQIAGMSANLPDILFPLYRAYANFLKLQLLNHYVTPNSSPFKNSDEKAISPLHEEIKRFITKKETKKEKKNVLLMHGEVGAGKSLAARITQRDLWDAWTSEESLLPLFIELKQISDKEGEFIPDYLQRVYNYTPQQINELKDNYNFVMIFDGMDECPSANRRCWIEDLTLEAWKNPKIIFTARTEWLNKEVEIHKQFKSDTTITATEVYIVPFSIEQIDDFLSKRFSNESADLQRTYHTFLHNQNNLLDLAKSPVMLYILTEILPEIISENTSIDYTLYALYDLFFNTWFMREIIKNQKPSLPQQSITGMKSGFFRFMRGLAFEMFKQNTLAIDRFPNEDDEEDEVHTLFNTQEKSNSHEEPAVDHWKFFFENNTPAMQQALRTCPLSLEHIDNRENRYYRYQFIHKSFMEYAVASHLLGTIKNPKLTQEKKIQAWNDRFLTEEYGILTFLQMKLLSAPYRHEIEEYLLQIVFASRSDPRVAKASSNAITLLNKLRFNFNQFHDQDFSGIQIPYADLSEAFMPCINLSRSNLSHVNFNEAVLANADLTYTNLTRATFLAGEAVILSREDVKTLAPHPQCADAIAYGEGKNVVVTSLTDNLLIQTLVGHSDTINSVTWSTTGALISGSADMTVKVWQKNETGIYNISIDLRHRHHDKITSVACSPDDQYLAIASENFAISIWKISFQTGRAELRYSLIAHLRFVTSVAWSQDGKYLASGSYDKTVRIWDIFTGRCIHTLQEHEAIVNSVAWSKTNKLASSSGRFTENNKDNSIIIWDTSALPEKITCLRKIENQEGWILCLAWSESGKLASSSGQPFKTNYNDVGLWDSNSLTIKSIQTFIGHKHAVNTVAWTIDGKLISGSDDKTIRTWELNDNSNQYLHKKNRAPIIIDVVVCNDGKIASAHLDGTMRVWRIEENIPTFQLLAEAKQPNLLAWSSQGLLALLVGFNGYLSIFSSDLTQSKKYLETKGKIKTLAWSPHGRQLAVGGDSIWIYDLNDEQEVAGIREFSQQENKVGVISWSKNGEHLAVGSVNKIIYIYDMSFEPGSVCNKQLIGHGGEIKSIEWSTEGEWLASADDKKLIYIWDMKYPKKESPHKILEGHNWVIGGLAWLVLKNACWLISANGGEIIFWNALNWHAPIIKWFFSGSDLNLRNNQLIVSKDIGVYGFDLTNFPSSTVRGYVIGQFCSLWLHNCNFFGAVGLLPGTRQFLSEERGCLESDLKEIKNEPSQEVITPPSIEATVNKNSLFFNPDKKYEHQSPLNNDSSFFSSTIKQQQSTGDQVALHTQRIIDKVMLNNELRSFITVEITPDGDCGFTATEYALRISGKDDLAIAATRLDFINTVKCAILELRKLPSNHVGSQKLSELLAPICQQAQITFDVSSEKLNSWGTQFNKKSQWANDVHFAFMSYIHNIRFEFYVVDHENNNQLIPRGGNIGDGSVIDHTNSAIGEVHIVRLLHNSATLVNPSVIEPNHHGSMTNQVGSEGQGYLRHEVKGDGDCGYTSFGITRGDATQLLLERLNSISDIIKIPVKHALLMEGFHHYLRNQEIVTASHIDISTNETLLEQYAQDLAVQSAYITYDVQDKNIDAGYSHPAVLQALAHIQGVAIHMWRLGENDVLLPLDTLEGNYGAYAPQEPSRRLDLLFINNNHFELLDLSSYESDIPERGIYPLKTSWSHHHFDLLFFEPSEALKDKIRSKGYVITQDSKKVLTCSTLMDCTLC